MNNDNYVCFEIGGTNLRYGIFSGDMSAVDFRIISTSGLSTSSDKSKFLSDLIEEIRNDNPNYPVKAIGFSLASLMNEEKTVVLSSPMISGFNNIELVTDLSSSTGLPVLLEKDVNTQLAYDIINEDIKDTQLSVGIYLGTGIGNAIYINGEVYSGTSNAAGELGHIPVYGNNDLCQCGKKGCIELLACGRVLEKLSEETFECKVEDIFTLHGNKKQVQEVVDYFSIAISTEITILNPEFVLLGGGLVHMKDFPIDELLEKVRMNLRTPNPRQSTKFIIVEDEEQRGIFGLLEIMKKRLI